MLGPEAGSGRLAPCLASFATSETLIAGHLAQAALFFFRRSHKDFAGWIVGRLVIVIETAQVGKIHLHTWRGVNNRTIDIDDRCTVLPNGR